MHYFDKPFLLELLWGTAQRRFQGYFDISTQKFFRAVQTSKMWNSQFYSMFLQGFRVHYLPLQGVSKRKNRHLLTFLRIKTISGVMRSCYLFLQVLMVMKTCLQTYYGIIIALENFLRSPKSSVVIRKIVIFCIIWIIFGSKSDLKGYEI